MGPAPNLVALGSLLRQLSYLYCFIFITVFFIYYCTNILMFSRFLFLAILGKASLTRSIDFLLVFAKYPLYQAKSVIRTGF